MKTYPSHSSPTPLTRSLGTWQVMVAGIALVVAASTLVTDFTGFFTLGSGFVIALGLGFIINLSLAVSAADLSASHPRAGALYHYASEIIPGDAGRFLGVFLGLAFFGMFAFAVSGETAAGAHGLMALVGWDIPLWVYIIVLGTVAMIPNLIGIKATTWFSAALLLFMLGIRWVFGLAGFLGLSRAGEWSMDNLASGNGWFDKCGIVTVGLALAFWSFVGIEFACSLAEEVKEPRKSMPRGLLWGLVAILVTTLVMGLGVTGTQPLVDWQVASNSALGSHGESPQLAVGQLMFGKVGFVLMALASVAATLGTLTVAYAAMPRILFGIARDGHFFGPITRPLARLHPRFGTPVAATLATFGIYQIPALYSTAVIDWLYSAAYAWILLYVVFHGLAIGNRLIHLEAKGAFPRQWLISSATAGICLTLFGLYYAFEGSHGQFGGRALILFAAALAITGLSFLRPSMLPRPSRIPPPEVSASVD